jgi:hypothetical protein
VTVSHLTNMLREELQVMLIYWAKLPSRTLPKHAMDTPTQRGINPRRDYPFGQGECLGNDKWPALVAPSISSVLFSLVW